jgi:serine/threonine protein kinase
MADEVTFTGQSGKTWRYWGDKPLGTPGGFGGVYAAESADGSPMAVKVVKKQRPQGTLDERLLRREIEIGKRVAESGSEMLLPAIDAADAGDALLLVMPLAEGALGDVSLPMAEAEVVAVLVDIATGLQDLHSILILHRDLKPANVLRHAGRWKLADFGLARDQEIGTQDPTFVGWGSFPYMAPELWELRSPAVKTDLYALGCVAYELLAGVPPYTGAQAAVRAGHLTQAPPEAPCSDTVLRNLIGRLIAKRPEDRPQDARAVLERLLRALAARIPVQEAIARGLGAHAAEQARAAAEQSKAQAAEDARHQLMAQAKADLREIVSDALSDLQAIEPDAASDERGDKRGWVEPSFTLTAGEPAGRRS